MPADLKSTPGLVSILIPVLNQWELLEKALHSIARHTSQPHEIVVVDNGSGPETRAFLASAAVRLVVNPANRGFAAAINQAVDAAAGETLVLANSDIEVTEGWLDEILLALEQPGAGLVGPLTNYASGAQQIPVDYAKCGGPDGIARELRHWRQGAVREVDRVVGFLLAYRRSTAELVGRWDERFGIGNFEDDDYCLRARLLGLRCLIAEGAFVHHEGSATFRAERIEYKQLIDVNRAKFQEKWRDPELALLPSLLKRLELMRGEEVRRAS